MQNGVIQNKLARIEAYLTKLQEIIPDGFKEFEKDWRTQMIAERGLQILIEIIIDVANRLIAINNWGPTTSSADSIRLLVLKKVISSEEPYLKMIKFRTPIEFFIVDKNDPNILYDKFYLGEDELQKKRIDLKLKFPIKGKTILYNHKYISVLLKG